MRRYPASHRLLRQLAGRAHPRDLPGQPPQRRAPPAARGGAAYRRPHEPRVSLSGWRGDLRRAGEGGPERDEGLCCLATRAQRCASASIMQRAVSAAPGNRPLLGRTPSRPDRHGKPRTPRGAAVLPRQRGRRGGAHRHLPGVDAASRRSGSAARAPARGGAGGLFRGVGGGAGGGAGDGEDLRLPARRRPRGGASDLRAPLRAVLQPGGSTTASRGRRRGSPRRCASCWTRSTAPRWRATSRCSRAHPPGRWWTTPKPQSRR